MVQTKEKEKGGEDRRDRRRRQTAELVRVEVAGQLTAYATNENDEEML